MASLSTYISLCCFILYTTIPMAQNSTTLIKQFAERNSLDAKTAKKLFNSVVSVVSDSIVKGEAVSIRGFGRFLLKKYSKNGVNPRTQQKMTYNVTRVSFKTAKNLKK